MGQATTSERTAEGVVSRERISRRDLIRTAAGGAVALGTAVRAPAFVGQAKPFAGISLRGACFQHHFQSGIVELLPEFEELTGIAVNLELQAFPIYNQRMDLELSTGGSSYDFCNITFPYSGRWIGSGWFTPLDEFLQDPGATPPEWDADDFVSGAQTAFRDTRGLTYGFAWVAGVMMMGIARMDLLEKAGLKVPQTFDDLRAVCAATHTQETAAFVNDKLHNWEWPPYLMGFGGRVFQDLDIDLTPSLNSPQAIVAADYYAHLLSAYAPLGVLTYNDDQALRAQLLGRANIRTTSVDWLRSLGSSSGSRVKDTVRFAPIPAGPAGRFPAVNANAYGIPAGARHKRAAWEFIKWALSKSIMRRMALEKNQHSTARRSIITDSDFRRMLTINGQDVASIYLDTMDQAGQGGYMRYRIVPVFPQIGEKINKAIERIVSKQSNAADAMAAAQRDAILDLRKARAL